MAKEKGYIPLPGDIQVVANLDGDRLVLESIREKFDALGVEQTAGSLILETDLGATTAETIAFQVMEDQGTEFDTEIRLARPDAFTITKFGIALAYRLKAGALADQGADRLLFGPSTDAQALGITADLIWAFQRGVLRMQSDTITYIETVDAGLRSRRVGVAQEGLDPGGGDVYLDNAWGPDHGMSPMVPSMTLSGSFKNKIEYILPRPVDLSNVSNTITLHAVLIMRGFQSQGGAEFRTAKPNQ